MTRVTVLREESGAREATYRAAGGHVQAAGRTPGEAVDALAEWLPDEQTGTLLIVRDLRPDRSFNAERRRRLEELMARWRSARDTGATFPADDQAELERLVEDEVRAAAERADEAWRELAR